MWTTVRVCIYFKFQYRGNAQFLAHVLRGVTWACFRDKQVTLKLRSLGEESVQAVLGGIGWAPALLEYKVQGQERAVGWAELEAARGGPWRTHTTRSVSCCRHKWPHS